MTVTAAQQDILRHLQKECRLTNQELADRTHMSASSCWRQVQALEQSGTITGYTAQVDAQKVGLGFSAVVAVSLARHETSAVEDFNRAILNRPEVLQCFSITGDADYVLRIVTDDMAAYNAFLNDFLFRQPCVVKANTNVVMATIKDSTALPL